VQRCFERLSGPLEVAMSERYFSERCEAARPGEWVMLGKGGRCTRQELAGDCVIAELRHRHAA
jgi:hypothetical protein